MALERKRIEDLVKTKGMPRGSYPPYTVSLKGPKVPFRFSLASRLQQINASIILHLMATPCQVTVKFKIPPSCDMSHLIIDITTHLAFSAEQDGAGSEMLLRAWDKSVHNFPFSYFANF